VGLRSGWQSSHQGAAVVHSLYVSDPGSEPPEIDTSVPNSARIWNYWLGGKDNYPGGPPRR
jgi:S-adenosyl methyltransferase